MDARQQRVLLSFRRAIAFIDARPNLTDGTTSEHAATTAQLDALKDIVERVSTNAAGQLTLAAATTYASTEEPALKHVLLQHHLRTIVKTARGLRGSVPGIGVLRMPHSGSRSARLVEEASSFAKQAAVYAPVLIEHGQPAEFITQLHSAIAAFQASIGARGAARNDLRGATRSIQQDIVAGRRTVMLLDGIISRRLAHDEPERTVWNAAKRVGRSSSSAHRSAVAGAKVALVDQMTPAADQCPAIADQSRGQNAQPTPSEHQRAA